MIEINLLPDELKVKTIKKPAPGGGGFKSFDPLDLIYLLPLVFGVLVITHLVLGIILVSSQARLSRLNKEWASLESQQQKITDFKSEVQASSQDAQIIDELTYKSIKWSEKLNTLSLALPAGVWFNEMSASRQSIEIKASVFSIESNEVDLINKFISNLKTDKRFIKDVSRIETGGMSTRRIGTYEVMEFTLTAAMGQSQAQSH